MSQRPFAGLPLASVRLLSFHSPASVCWASICQRPFAGLPSPVSVCWACCQHTLAGLASGALSPELVPALSCWSCCQHSLAGLGAGDLLPAPVAITHLLDLVLDQQQQQRLKQQQKQQQQQ